MDPVEKIKDVQKELTAQNLDGWLLYDFRRTNNLACLFLEFPQETFLSRRLFYWIPAKGVPVKILHHIEQYNLDHFPGEKLVYRSWQELEACLGKALKGAKSIAMEYSPRNAVPYVSKVDGGTIDLIREYGVKVVSSALLLQKYTSVCTEEQAQSHFKAAETLDDTVAKAWQFIHDELEAGNPLNEYDVQRFIVREMEKYGCHAEEPPLCCVNAHAADPHYVPTIRSSSPIRKGDFILLDLWCKTKEPGSIYADITRVGVAAKEPTAKQKEIFSIVRRAQEVGITLIKERFGKNEPIMGWEVDQACRKVITDAGYGEYFTHRTGHNLHEEDHGKGAHLDNLETQDFRPLLPGTCFTIEPGIYLPDEFGVRLEFDVYVSLDCQVFVTGGIQDEILCLFN